MANALRGRRRGNAARMAEVLALLAVASCSADPVPQPFCRPGTSSACTCTNGAAGAQACDLTGMFRACVCGDAGERDVLVMDVPAIDTRATVDAGTDAESTDFGTIDAEPTDVGAGNVDGADVPRDMGPTDTSADVLPDGCASTTPGDCCGVACAAADHATPMCSEGVCGLSCTTGYGNCDLNLTNGCEATLASDDVHCGRCGAACPVDQRCTGGHCACPTGQVACGGRCVETQGDAANCGSCANACGTGFACTAGHCAGCPTGQTMCGTRCVNVQTDAANCGRCAHACAIGASCSAGNCSTTCPGGQTQCSGQCVNVQTDVSNCGACGAVCALMNASTSTCVSGTCRVGTCAMGSADCDGMSVNGCEMNTLASVDNCGVCGNRCPTPAHATPTCTLGACGFACTADLSDCDGMVSTGCETNTQTSAAHCGGCGRACTSAQTCTSGSCVALPTCSSGMRLIPAGMFVMGDPMSDDLPAQPVHGVRLTAFCMDATEVTVSSYEACVAAARCTAPGTTSGCNWGVSGRNQHPLNCVDWSQSRAYCQWRGGDLPTEAQWEYAARGTDGRMYPWGNYGPGSQLCWSGYLTNRSSTCIAGSFAGGNSPFGLFDMAGNVYEWTLDWYAPYMGNSNSYVLNPTGSGSGSYRVFRGGSWADTTAIVVRSSLRRGSLLDRINSVGFRCAQDSM